MPKNIERYCILPGSRWGRLVVQRSFKDPSSQKIKIECKCDCGNISYPTKVVLYKGLVKSCGCVQKEYAKNRIPCNKLKECESARNSKYTFYKRSAKERGIEFCLTLEEFTSITQKKCFYCGSQPSNISRSKNNGNFIYNGIDRINNDKGYIFNNCCACCGDCNLMKSVKSLKNFTEKCDRISNSLHLYFITRDKMFDYYEQE